MTSAPAQGEQSWRWVIPWETALPRPRGGGPCAAPTVPLHPEMEAARFGAGVPDPQRFKDRFDHLMQSTFILSRKRCWGYGSAEVLRWTLAEDTPCPRRGAGWPLSLQTPWAPAPQGRGSAGESRGCRHPGSHEATVLSRTAPWRARCHSGGTGVARIPVLTAVTDLSLFSWDRSSWTTESLASRELLLNPRSVGHPSSDVCYPGDLGDILGHSGVVLPVPCPEPWDRGPRCTPEA